MKQLTVKRQKKAGAIFLQIWKICKKELAAVSDLFNAGLFADIDF